VEGTRLEVSGQLTLASTERLDRLLEEHEGLRTLVIGPISVAGADDVTSLLQKGMLIRGAGLSTLVAPGVTLRGDAAYLAFAGVERRLGEDARLVLTGWDTPQGPAAELPRDHPAHQERLDYVTRMLGAADAYWFALETGGTEGHALSRAEALSLGILTEG
ncbi:MAG: hypothetical protein ACOCTP_05110, partial [Roseicyclus sp.]